MSFITYGFYTNEYGGDLIPSNKFKRLSIRASAYINSITFNRIDKELVSKDVCFATCAIADTMYKIERDGGIKSSESVGNHSVTYKTNGNSREEKILYKIAKTYLVHTGLLYRGVYYDN